MSSDKASHFFESSLKNSSLGDQLSRHADRLERMAEDATARSKLIWPPDERAVSGRLAEVRANLGRAEFFRCVCVLIELRAEKS